MRGCSAAALCSRIGRFDSVPAAAAAVRRACAWLAVKGPCPSPMPPNVSACFEFRHSIGSYGCSEKDELAKQQHVLGRNCGSAAGALSRRRRVLGRCRGSPKLCSARRPWQLATGSSEGERGCAPPGRNYPRRSWPHVADPTATENPGWTVFHLPSTPGRYFVRGRPRRRGLAGAPPYPGRSARAPLPFLQKEVQSRRLRARRCHEEPIAARVRRSSSRGRGPSERLTDGDSPALPMGTRGKRRQRRSRRAACVRPRRAPLFCGETQSSRSGLGSVSSSALAVPNRLGSRHCTVYFSFILCRLWMNRESRREDDRHSLCFFFFLLCSKR